MAHRLYTTNLGHKFLIVTEQTPNFTLVLETYRLGGVKKYYTYINHSETPFKEFFVCQSIEDKQASLVIHEILEELKLKRYPYLYWYLLT